jgi:serine protease Do
LTDENDKKEIIQEAPIVADRSVMPGTPHISSDITKKTPGKVKLRFLSAAALIIVSLSAGFAGGWLGARNSGSTTVEKQQVVLKSQGQLISSIANEVSPSVVSVEVTSQSRAVDGFFGFGGTREQQSAGTGFIIDKSGIIVTNRHVVPSGSTKINVTLSDGTKFENVELIGRTSESDPLDVAFLKITDTKGKELKAARIGDSSTVKVGESVVAIGNALGQFQNTVTSGIISGHGRNVTAGDATGSASENLQNLFQTDAAINQGNSGGPLVNLDGEVIGINTAVAGDAQNIGFAIPMNDVKGVIENVVKKGKLERPFIGVVFVPVTADLAKQYNLTVDQGAYIPPSVSVGQETVMADSPAGRAGIKEQDIIVKVNNDVIDESHSLTSLLGKYTVGDKVKLDIVRDGKHQTIEVTLAAAPEN